MEGREVDVGEERGEEGEDGDGDELGGHFSASGREKMKSTKNL